MATPGVSPSLIALAETALAEWGLAGAGLEPKSISENITFRVDAADDTFVLRIHRPGYHTLAELQSEHLWTRALRTAGLDVPEVLDTPGGAGYITLPHEGGQRNIGMLKWVDGELLGTLIQQQPAQLTAHFRSLGRIAAGIHNQSASWQVPAGFERHSFDVDGLVGARPFWGRFWELPALDSGQRALLGRARETIAKVLDDYGKNPQTYSLIHADLHPHNVVVSDHGLHVIDFDDSGFGWHQYELAVALYAYRQHKLFPEIQAAMVEGYRSVRPFAETALAMLPMFLLIRSLVSLGWRQQRPEHGTDLSREIAGACAAARSWLR